MAHAVIGQSRSKFGTMRNSSREFDWNTDYEDLITPASAPVLDPEPEHAMPRSRLTFAPAQQTSLTTPAHQTPLQGRYTEAPARERGTSKSVWMAAVCAAFLAGLFADRIEVGGVFAMGKPASGFPATFGLDANAFAPAERGETRPSELVAYDLQQYQRVSAELSRMSTADLQDYLSATRHQLRHAPAKMEPFHRDMLFLLNAEIARRGG